MDSLEVSRNRLAGSESGVAAVSACFYKIGKKN